MSDLAIEASDRPLRPDQYTYVETHAWWLGSFGRHNHLSEQRLRTWVPARPEREWLLDREFTGKQTWLTGSADEAHDDGFDLRDIGPVGRFRARYGEFDTGHSEPLDGDPHDPHDPHAPLFDVGCAPTRPRRRGSWQSPTPEFMAELPRDPSELLGRLREENPGSWFGPFAAAVTVLRSSLARADLRRALYRAVTGLPAVSVAAGVRNVDGHECIAIVHDTGRTRTELMIAPDGGGFAGERDTLRMDSRCGGLKAGTVISSTAVHTAVVDVLGEQPRR